MYALLLLLYNGVLTLISSDHNLKSFGFMGKVWESALGNVKFQCLEWQQLTIQGCWFRGQENRCINLNLHQKPFSGKTFDIADLELKEL